MKRTPLIFLIASLLLIFGTATVFAAGLSQSDSPFTIVALSPEVPYPGQEVVGTITYDEAAELAGETVNYEVSYTIAAEGVEGTAECPGSNCSFVADESGTSTINFYAPDAEGTYTLTIELTVGENVLQQTLGSKSLVVETALPAGLTQLFAGLGLFAAVMAIMAVGTEVVIETLKMFLGFKSKVSAMEAFDELKAELPGMLAGVGVDAKSREKVVNLIEETETSLKSVTNIPNIYANLTEGNFVDAYQALVDLQNGTPTDLQDLKDKAKVAVHEGLEKLRDQLHIDPDMTRAIEEEINLEIDKFTISGAASILDDVFIKLREIFNDTDKVKKWLLGQMNLYLNTGRAGLNGFLADGKAALEQLGFDSSEVDKWLTPIVDGLEQTARDKAQVYAESVKNLLEEVEERRNLMQSPFRKLWRRFRNSNLPGGILWVAVAFVLLPALVWGIFRIYPLNLLNEEVTWQIYWGDALLLGLLFSILVFIVLFVVLLFTKNVSPEPKKGSPQKGTLGYVLRYYIERPFNMIIGHAASAEDAATYGQADSALVQKVQNTDPTTVASTLLALDNKHKDEETTRIRWMRIFSIVIGIILAYRLNVDAATYLNYAVPGIEKTINAIDLTQYKFVQYWFPLPQGLTVGMILTGFAASAGSKFWRDLLGRLQAARGQAEEAAQAVRKVKSTISELT